MIAINEIGVEAPLFVLVTFDKFCYRQLPSITGNCPWIVLKVSSVRDIIRIVGQSQAR
jgi:hypothetical protein